MLRDSHAFSGFSAKDLDAEKKFYEEMLGLDVEQTDMGLKLNIAGGNPVFVYQKDNHEPATYTVLNFPVDDIDAVVDGLKAKGVSFERYEGFPFEQDEKGIARGKAANMGPDIAWFTDPAGNTLAVLSN